MEGILGGRKVKALPMSLLMTASILAVAVMMVSTAYGGPVPKATGYATVQRVGTTGPDGQFTVQISVFDYGTTSDRGMFKYVDSTGYYVLEIVSTKIACEYVAAFTGQATESTHSAVPVGQWVVIMVADLGEPGWADNPKADRCAGWLVADETEALKAVADSGIDPPEGVPWHFVIDGNIQVHYDTRLAPVPTE